MAAATDESGLRDTGVAYDSDSDMTGPGGGKVEDDLSAEDAAWVDSCLVKDDEHAGGEGSGEYLSDDSWATLTEAFVTALASVSGAATTQDEGKVDKASSASAREASRRNASEDELMPQAAAADGFQDDVFEEPSSPTASSYVATFYDQAPPTLGDAGATSGDGPSTDEARFKQTAEESNGHLDAAEVVVGSEFPEEQGYGSDTGDEFPFAAAGQDVGEVELTTGVFRLWELDAPDEEDEDDEFSSQLKKALEGSVVTPLAEEQSAILDEWKTDSANPDLDDHRLEKSGAVLDEQDLQELITGITGISLRPPPSSISTQQV